MSDRAFFFQGDMLLLPADYYDSQLAEGVPLERVADFSFDKGNDETDVFEIPSLSDPPSVIRVVSVLPQATLPDNSRGIPLRQVLSLYASGQVDCADSDINTLVRACHIAQWRHTSRFCGTCGAENCDPVINEPIQIAATPFPFPPPPFPQTQLLPPPHRICPKCGRHEFPRICPAVIVIITDDKNRILLAHNKKFRTGVYSHISGFNEAGETLEETIVREVREEVSIEIKDIEYVKSQPWPFPCSLMIGYRARHASGTLKPDGEEIEDAGWFTKDNLPELPGAGSLSRFLIDEWKG